MQLTTRPHQAPRIMSVDDAVDALKRLGLPTYEARVFVALQEIGSGTAQAISDRSDVPRSQVYGAAENLAERGLVEITESSPKSYRPVKLSTARELFTERLEAEQERAFQTLDSLRATEPEPHTGQDVSTLRGRRPIDDRISSLISEAERRVVLVAPSTEALTEGIESALREAGMHGREVTVVTADRPIKERFAAEAVEVVVMSADNPADFAGRALMVDEGIVLLAAETEDAPVDEEALWTGDSQIGRILAQFMRSGMESGRGRQG